MRGLSESGIAKWTSCTLGCDFSGFAIPTTETAPWGQAGEVVAIDLVVDPDSPNVVSTRRVSSGVWSRDHHALAIAMPTRRDPGRIGTIGLFGLVMVGITPGWQVNRSGFVAHGRSLLEDEGKLAALLTGIAAAEMDRLATSFDALRATLPWPSADAAQPATPSRI